jgi:hypothetical protein
MTLRPACHFVQRRPKRGAERRKRVLHLQARLTEDGARHKAIAFQLAEVLDEHLVSDVGDGSLQIVETLRTAVPEQPEDQRFPLAAYDVDRQLHGTGVGLLSSG